MNITGSVAGSASGMLSIEGEGDKINITPILESGTKIASVTINEGTPDEETIELYAPEGFSGSWNDLTDKPDLFSGAYGDLTGKPYVNGKLLNGSIYTEHYSTNEKVIGTWVDGSVLYQCTFEVTLTQNVTHIDTSALNVKKLVECFGVCDTPGGENCLFVPYYEDSTWRMIPAFDYANQELNIVTTNQVLNYYNKLSITIKYVKNES